MNRTFSSSAQELAIADLSFNEAFDTTVIALAGAGPTGYKHLDDLIEYGRHHAPTWGEGSPGHPVQAPYHFPSYQPVQAPYHFPSYQPVQAPYHFPSW